MKHAAAYAACLAATVALDLLWLGKMGAILYRPALGELLADNFRPAPAIAFYLLYAFGVVFFVVAPALESKSWAEAAFKGALFGLVGYGVYDLTNQATLKNWPVAVTLADMAWGAFLTACAATAGFFAGRAV
jgi:uncharacterized membrane protein